VASDILACSNESKTAVLVELDEQGSATVSLRGELAERKNSAPEPRLARNGFRPV